MYILLIYSGRIFRDYAANVRLDNYESDDMDEAEYEGMDLDERRALEARLGKRDRAEGRSRLPGAFLDRSGEMKEFWRLSAH
jgi:hypothetical protein